MEVGFVKADSSNLPKVDALMVVSFFTSNQNFCAAEFRNIKTSISTRESYGDDAIGYVQLRREANMCTLKCKICPEHKVRQKPYSVSMVVDELEDIVKEVQCHDCPASQGGCKHVVAVLMWVHRRSEEPSCTSTECYWRKSKLAKVGTTLKGMPIKEMLHKSEFLKNPEGKTVLKDFIEESKKRKLDGPQLLKHQPGYEVTGVHMLTLHYLSAQYNKERDCNKFLDQIAPVFTRNQLNAVESQTREQHQNNTWYELRYARITASKAFEVTRCKTPNGSLVALIMGGKMPDTPAMKRGRNLEDVVRKEVERQFGRIAKCGLYISNDHPMLAATPDGILNEDTVIEIKCPASEKSYKLYSHNNEITEKFATQVQLQMHITGLEKCLFCVADPDFERNNKVEIISVPYDKSFANNVVGKLVTFWKNNIYGLLYQSTQ